MTTTAIRPLVLRPADLKSHDRGGGACTTPLVSAGIGATGFINGITEFGPGVAIPFHSHNCEESVMLLEGHAMLEMEGEEAVALQPQDTTWIPPNLSHRFRNLSDTEPMKIFWTYASLQATRTLTATGECRQVSAEHNR
ncbi:MAG: cupin domain-containing protein [Polaromonas sp.]|uniref:cupin domain-containing protein n=1 Tax=Polaromonas sp. TaxID=1869339 RepID=UPI002733BE2F|nr:cupin domain-containing protein [Polaromonas sp.]MDP3799522.1 cupin domain-containing protein [Polaromonas sp.]